MGLKNCVIFVFLSRYCFHSFLKHSFFLHPFHLSHFCIASIPSPSIHPFYPINSCLHSSLILLFLLHFMYFYLTHFVLFEFFDSFWKLPFNLVFSIIVFHPNSCIPFQPWYYFSILVFKLNPCIPFNHCITSQSLYSS